jgi:predicted metal-binding protein
LSGPPSEPAPVIELIACETCGGSERDAAGRSRGQQLLELLRTASDPARDRALTLSSTACLWACSRSCAVHLRGAGRVGYVLCELAPEPAHATALLEYAAQYAASSDGCVPYRQWPEPLRGHFLCRIPNA